MVCLSQINRSTSFPVLGTQGRFNIANESLIACRGRPEGRSSALVSLEGQSPPPSFVTVSTAWASRNSVIQSMQQEQGPTTTRQTLVPSRWRKQVQQWPCPYSSNASMPQRHARHCLREETILAHNAQCSLCAETAAESVAGRPGLPQCGTLSSGGLGQWG